MTTDEEKESLRMLQAHRIAVIRDPRATPFVHVYSSQSYRDGFHCFPFFLPSDQVESFLSDTGWDKRNGDLTPHVVCSESVVHGREVYYLPTGDERGRQAFIHDRTFPNYWPSSLEVCEEFRLFHKLYYHSDRSRYLHCDVHGNEHEVVRIKDGDVEVSLRFLSEFLQAKQMALALQYEGNYWGQHTLDALELKPENKEGREEHALWELVLRDSRYPDEAKSISLLHGKAVIPCPGPLVWNDPYKEDPEQFQKFIVGHDQTGKPIYDTCDYDQIRADYGRAMAPVYFKRSVLAKYYDDPQRYEINAHGLWCGSNWHLKMDHDGRKYVTVFLKDISSLPPSERDHWINFNVLPDGPISESSFTRNIRGWFAEAAMPDTQFKPLYRTVNERWRQVYGWPLWLEPTEGDAHLLRQAHVCLDDGQAEFDEQNGIMAKLLSEFLNGAKLNSKGPQNERLNHFRAFMEAEGFKDANVELGPFFAFQALRSKGAAHRKGNDYKEALKKGGLDGRPLGEASYILFERIVGALRWISKCLDEKAEQREKPAAPAPSPSK